MVSRRLWSNKDIENLKRKWAKTDQFEVFIHYDDGGSLVLYNAGGHVGTCETFEEKVNKLKQTCCNGIFMYYYYNIQNPSDFIFVKCFN